MSTIATARAAERQLDIIADTALAADPRLHTASSSVVAKTRHAAVHTASLSVDPQIAAIEKRRAAIGMEHAELCRLADVERNNWYKLRQGEHRPSARTVAKLQAALAMPRPVTPPQIIVAFHRLVMQLLALQMAFDVNTLLATDFSVQRPSNPLWLRAARIRQMAIYITTVELQVSNADLGRALGDTRANIKFARDAIEDRREDGNEIDLALTAVTLQVRAG